MTKKQDKAIVALKKARSNIDKVIKMIEKNESEIDTIQQSLAAIGLLKSTNLHLLENYLNSSIVEGKNLSSNKIEKLIENVTKIVRTAQNK